MATRRRRFQPGQERHRRRLGHGHVEWPVRDLAGEDHVPGRKVVRLLGIGFAASEHGEFGPAQQLFRPASVAERAEPLEVVTPVAAHAEDPAAAPSGATETQAHVEPTLPLEQATTDEQAEQGKHDEQRQHSDDDGDPLEQRHRTVLPCLLRQRDSAARSRVSALRVASGSSPASARAASARSRSISSASSATSARIVTTSSATERNPPWTAALTTSASGVRIVTGPVTRRPSRGWWPGMIPMSPSVVLVITIEACPDHTLRSAATSSTCSSATGSPSYARAHARYIVAQRIPVHRPATRRDPTMCASAQAASLEAFSSAVSMFPTMWNACSGRWSYSPLQIPSKDSSVSESGTNTPGCPVKASAANMFCDRNRCNRRARFTVILSSSDSSSMPRIAMMSCRSLYRCRISFTRWAIR